MYDYDKSDSISPDEMRDLLSELGFELAEAAITEVSKAFGTS